MGNCLSSTSRSSGSRRIATAATSALPPTELILNYWLGGDGAQFRQLWDPCTTPSNQSKWFGKSDETDMEIKTMFGAEVDRLPEIIAAVSSPSGTVDDTVAAIILGDQMSRNIYRGSKIMYRWDSIVLPLAKSLLADEDAFMARLPLTFKLFTLLPLMHSEEVGDQRACVAWVERVREAVPEGEEGKAAAEAGREEGEIVPRRLREVGRGRSDGGPVAAQGYGTVAQPELGRIASGLWL